jgi:hypothetical protein
MISEDGSLTLLADVFLLGALFFLGVSFARWAGSDSKSGYVPWLAFPLGAGIFSWILFLLSWAGIHFTLFTSSIVYCLLMVPALWFSRIRGEGRRSRTDGVGGEKGHFRPSPISTVLCIVGASMLITSALLSIGLAYSTWDAIAIYAGKGYGIALEESILAGKEWGALGLSRPMNLPILISFFRFLDGDVLPGSKLLYPMFFASLLGGTYVFWRNRGVDKMAAAAGTLFLGSLPIVFQHSTNGYTNLPFCVYLLLGVFIGIEGIQNKDRTRQRWSGLMLALACWTRSEGAFLAPLLMLTLLLVHRYQRRGKVFYVDWISPVAGLLGFWFVFTQTHNGSSVIQHTLKTAFESWLAFDFHFDAIYETLRFIGAQILKLEVWGLIVPVVLLLAFRQRRNLAAQRSRGEFSVLVLSFIMGFSTLALYYLASFTRDLRLQLETSADRIVLPTGILILVWAVLNTADSMGEVNKRLDR